MRAAIGLRLLLALTLMGWGQLAFASTLTYWTSDAKVGSRYSTALEACKASHGFPYSYLMGGGSSYDTYTCYGSHYQNGSGAPITTVKKVTASCQFGHE